MTTENDGANAAEIQVRCKNYSYLFWKISVVHSSSNYYVGPCFGFCSSYFRIIVKITLNTFFIKITCLMSQMCTKLRKILLTPSTKVCGLCLEYSGMDSGPLAMFGIATSQSGRTLITKPRIHQLWHLYLLQNYITSYFKNTLHPPYTASTNQLTSRWLLLHFLNIIFNHSSTLPSVHIES